MSSGEREARADRDWKIARATTINVADHSRRHEYAFHSDGEPCMVAMTSRNCPLSHQYGRTFEESV